jgi:large subunit ribosomal protein L11
MSPSVKALIEGGKATAGPPLGPALGPLGVNVGKVVEQINQKTAPFAGMKVPVTVVVNKKTGEVTIEVGSPPVSALIRKKLGLEKAAKLPGSETVGNLTIQQAVEIAKMKIGSAPFMKLKAKVKEILGTCKSMGISVEGKDPKEVQQEIDEGKYDEVFK